MLHPCEQIMQRKVLNALAITFVMLLSGCTGLSGEEEIIAEQDEEKQLEPIIGTMQMSGEVNADIDSTHFISISNTIENSGLITELFTIYVEFYYENNYLVEVENISIRDGYNFTTIWTPSMPGIWRVAATLTYNDSSYQIQSIPNSIESSMIIEVSNPTETAFITMDTVHELESERPYSISGNVTHIYSESPFKEYEECRIYTDLGFQTTTDENGAFTLSLGMVEEDLEFFLTAECSYWTLANDSRYVRIILAGSDDMDGDGISDEDDSCPDGIGSDEGWLSNDLTDVDTDGCHDFDEDLDDDNDGISDYDDGCSSDIGWISNAQNDYDSDGCDDSYDDEDDDGDGIIDTLDQCPNGMLGWESSLYTDWDSDGCNDQYEDPDDDNDGINDIDDLCWKGFQNWISTPNLDYDGDGCNDLSEDDDDDSDGVNDVNETGVTLDLCPRSPLNATDIDSNGCDATERDTDQDGVMDSNDECQGTPIGNPVNDVGCADLDGDGVFSNVDNCPLTMEKWTPDNDGCAVYQLPISFTEAGGNGRMDKVSHFSLTTLDGTWSFRNEWSGHDVYLFLFKYTDSSGNTNNADWAGNPGTLIRKLPDNVHLFYGSYDNSYNSDVTSRKTAVMNALNPDEELKWQDRIHYINQDASTIGGGLGDLINSWGALSYGIDRFQRARETGSIYAWTTSSNDHSHWAYEPRMYNYEFMTEIRESDPSVHVVTVMDEYWHSGGWQGGYTTTTEAINMSLPNGIESYDTLEVFHEHGCEDRRNRYTKSDGSEGGCHEWDYLAYLKICDRDNNSKCGTEFMRWITTYGREGRWLTDISPYLFMLQENDSRVFKYQGANKGLLTVKLLFSDWNVGERSFSGEKIFDGGQFNGQYNNESLYKRQHNFTTLSQYDGVKIVATITGHGFNQDQANCAEFCDHQHHYYLNGYHTYEWHPIIGNNEGCEELVDNGVTANQYGTWPYGRAGWCAGQDVKQWTYDITDWVDNSSTNNLLYKGLYNGQEYQPQNTNGGSREIRANILLVWYNQI